MRSATKVLAAFAILVSAMPAATAMADGAAVQGRVGDTSPSVTIEVPAVGTPAFTPANIEFQAVNGRPRYIAGYTQHALDRMAERRISKDTVESVIASHNNGVWQPDHRTWKVCWGGTCVAINDDAYIVTVF